MNYNSPDFSDVPISLTPMVAACIQALRWHRSADTAPTGIVLITPPGVGGTMIARRLPGLITLDDHQRRQLTAEYDGRPQSWSGTVPFRAPHHTVSAAGLTGAKRRGLPGGELQLARFGVLMLDELPEFRLRTLERLAYERRGMVGAPFIIATAAPCLCGWQGSIVRKCECTDKAAARHMQRVDRFAELLNLCQHMSAGDVSLAALRDGERCESTDTLREQLEGAAQ